MDVPIFIVELRDKIEPVLQTIDNVIPIPYARYLVIAAVFIPLLTFLMNLWGRFKPTQNLHSAKIKGKGAGNLKKEAKMAERAGRYVHAAEAWKALGKPNKALALYQKGGASKQAGELLINMGRKEEAIQMWLTSNNHLLAAKTLAADGQFERAATSYERAGNFSQAGEMFEKTRNYEKAGEHYEKAGFHSKAAVCYEKTGATLSAAKAYDHYFREQAVHLQEKPSVEKENAIRKLAHKSGTYYLQAGKTKEAAEVFLKGGHNADAAKAFEKLGELEKAAKLYQEAKLHDDAARLHETGGNTVQAATMKAEAFRSQGKIVEAAHAYAEAEDYHMAADFFARAEMHAEAAEMLIKSGSYIDAGSLFAQAGNKHKAAWAYEHAREYDTSLSLYREVGDLESAVRVMMAADRHLEAAQTLLQQKRANDAYKILERIPPDHSDYRGAAVIMSKMQASQNRLDIAVSLIQRAIKGDPVDTDTIDLYYSLATLFEQRGDYQLAIEIYSKVVAENITYKDAGARQQALREKLSHTAPAPPSMAMDTANPDKTAMLPAEGGAGARSNPRYQITGELGRGGMGVVYKAHDSVLDREVAYKVLPPSLKDHDDVVKKFGQEATALAKLLHQNIVTVFDAGGIGGEYYFVMEYVEGQNLKEIIREKGAFPIPEVISIFKQLAEALRYAHSKDVVHRDIKTSNVMLPSDGTVKLMDFGLAKILEGAASERTAVSGTPYYMSPEQTLGEGVDHRTDLYSLGVMMYEMAAGRVPFTSGDIGYHHLHTEPEPPSTIRPEIPEALEKIILKAMRKKKEERYQSAGEIVEELNKI